MTALSPLDESLKPVPSGMPSAQIQSDEGVYHHLQGKVGLIHGLPGQLGRALLLRLLTDFDLEKIYVTYRPHSVTKKKAKQRLADLFDHSDFQAIKSNWNHFLESKKHSHPHVHHSERSFEQTISRIVPIDIDLSQESPNLTDPFWRQLAGVVDVVWNTAGTMDFSANPKDIDSQCIESSLNLLKFTETCEHDVSLIHLSTAYASISVGSGVFPESSLKDSVGDWKVERRHLRRHADLSSVSPIARAAALAEVALQTEKRATKLAIVRPSMIYSALESPSPGWLSGFAGLPGLTALVALGELRELLGRPDLTIDVIPIDLVVNSLLVSAYALRSRDFDIFHCCSSDVNPLTWGEFIESHLGIMNANPLVAKESVRFELRESNSLRTRATKLSGKAISKLLNSQVLTSHRERLGPTLSQMLSLRESLETRSEIMSQFARHEWVFVTEKLIEIHKTLPLAEQRQLKVSPLNINWTNYIQSSWTRMRQSLLSSRFSKLISRSEPKGPFEKFLRDSLKSVHSEMR